MAKGKCHKWEGSLTDILIIPSNNHWPKHLKWISIYTNSMYPFFKITHINHRHRSSNLEHINHLSSNLEYLYQWKRTLDYGCQFQCVLEALRVIFNLYNLGTTAENSDSVDLGGPRHRHLNKFSPYTCAASHTHTWTWIWSLPNSENHWDT